MNKAFEKILERLEELIEKSYYSAAEGNRNAGIKNSAYHKVKKIVQEVAEEYNGGWISCSERLPQEKDGVVLICDENGEVGTGRYSEFSNQWYIGDMCAIGGSKVIAYQPLPEPYKEGE